MKQFVAKLDPEQLLWGFLSLASFFLTGAAAVIALSFAAASKPHVLAHMAFAYALLWTLQVVYSRAYRGGRAVFSFKVWVVLVLFLAFLCFVHLDDAPARAVYQGGQMVQREMALSLYWAAAFDASSAVVLTAHVLWLRRRVHRLVAAQRSGSQEGGSSG